MGTPRPTPCAPHRCSGATPSHAPHPPPDPPPPLPTSQSPWPRDFWVLDIWVTLPNLLPNPLLLPFPSSAMPLPTLPPPFVPLSTSTPGPRPPINENHLELDWGPVADVYFDVVADC